jgi:putative peptidoglycan lipid II flippase
MFASVRTLLLGGIIGKLAGIARELLSAGLLGTGPIASAYRLSQAAFIIPLNGLLAESLTSGFTPNYSRERAECESRSRALFAGMHSVLLIVSSLIGLVVARFAVPWVELLAPGFETGTVQLTSKMVQVMVWAMPLYAFTSLCAAAELAAGKPRMAAARASITSFGLMVGIVFAWVAKKPILIPAGFVASYICLAAWGLKSLSKEKLRLWPTREQWTESRKGLERVWRAFRLVVWIPVVMQCHFVIERRVASVVNANAVAALDYARFISETAVLILAMPFGLAGLAAMARMDEKQFLEATWRSSRMLLFVGIPLSTAIAVHAEWVVRVVFARGAFGAESIAVTTTILRGFGIGLWAQLVGYAGVKFLNARSDNFAIVSIYVVSLGINIAMNLLLQTAMGAAALGASSAVSSIVLGLAIMARLGQIAPLQKDLLSLCGGAFGYAALCLVLPEGLLTKGWLPPLLFLGYWFAVAVVFPRYREVFVDIFTVLHPNRLRVA